MRKGSPEPIAGPKRARRAAPKAAKAPLQTWQAKAWSDLSRLSAQAWAFLRGPGWTTASKVAKACWILLARAWTWLEAALRPPQPEPEPVPQRQLPGNLRFSDLDIDEPDEALQALRRAARIPPHQRHIHAFRDE